MSCNLQYNQETAPQQEDGSATTAYQAFYLLVPYQAWIPLPNNKIRAKIHEQFSEKSVIHVAKLEMPT
jgi:hypothetical protein